MFQNSKKIYLGVHLDTLCLHTKFREEMAFSMACVKKIILCLKIGFHETFFLSFLHI
jgi:hypothetical protein